jgi:hypothetical protein
MLAIELSLVLVYICILLVKSCQMRVDEATEPCIRVIKTASGGKP